MGQGWGGSMIDGTAAPVTGDKTIGNLRRLLQLTVAVLVLIEILVSVASFVIGRPNAPDITETLSRWLALSTILFLIAQPVMWVLGGAAESRLVQRFFRDADLPPIQQQFVQIMQAVAIVFSIVLGIMMIGTVSIFVAPNFVLDHLWIRRHVDPANAWFCMLLSFLLFTVTDIVSWHARRWFLKHLILNTSPLYGYYFSRRHIRRLTLQSVCPALLVCIAIVSRRIDTVPGALACGVFLASVLYSESVVGLWRIQMKTSLRSEWTRQTEMLARMITNDRILKAVLYGWFVINLVMLVVWSMNGIIREYDPVIRGMYDLRDQTSHLFSPTALALALGAVALLFKLQSRLLYGVMETVIGIVFVWNAIPTTRPEPPSGLDLLKVIAGIFVFMRGLENSHGALPGTRVDIMATIDNFGRWRIFQ